MKCECGCGQDVKKNRRFISGHNSRCRSEVTRRKLGDANRGKSPTKKTREKLSDALIGRRISDEQRKKQSEYMKGNQIWTGRTHTTETKAKLSEIQKGNKHGEGNKGQVISIERRKKISESMMGNQHSKGRVVSLKTRNKISAAKKGQMPWIAGKHHTEESLTKMSLSRTGVKLSEEHKQKIGEANKGRIVTEETKKKMSVASKGKYTGPNASAWQGGISYLPYCHKFNETFKERIREKYDRICFMCGKSEDDNIRKLSIHHVNYDKSCLCDDMACEFVPLCIGCHSKTNHNRDYWEEFIMSKLELVT